MGSDAESSVVSTAPVDQAEVASDKDVESVDAAALEAPPDLTEAPEVQEAAPEAPEVQESASEATEVQESASEASEVQEAPAESPVLEAPAIEAPAKKKKKARKKAKKKSGKKAKKKAKRKSKKKASKKAKADEAETADEVAAEPAVELKAEPVTEPTAEPIAESTAEPTVLEAPPLELAQPSAVETSTPAAPVAAESGKAEESAVEDLADSIGTGGLLSDTRGVGQDASLGIDLSQLSQALAADREETPAPLPALSPTLQAPPAPVLGAGLLGPARVETPAASSSGQISSGNSAIAVVDLNRINKAVRREKEAEEVARFRDDMLKKLATVRQTANRNYNDLAKQFGAHPTPLQQRELAAKRQEGQEEIKQIQEVATVELNKLRLQFSARLRQEIGPFVQQVAQQQQRSLVILRNEAFLFVDASADITDSVIEALLRSGHWARRASSSTTPPAPPSDHGNI